MNSWGTYGIRLSSILDRLSFTVTQDVKHLLSLGYLVDDGWRGEWFAERDTVLRRRFANLPSFFVIFGGTLVTVGPERSPIGTVLQRGYVYGTGWAWRVDRVLEPLHEDDTIDSWLSRADLPSMETPIGLPWEIARIADPVARLSAIQAYEASCG